jgi:hypothetical protein
MKEDKKHPAFSAWHPGEVSLRFFLFLSEI